jgi:hypothetical protein
VSARDDRAGDPDPLEIVKRSPELVGVHDKDGWLALYTDDATLEDPVGGGVHRGPAALGKFWDVFIAPNEVRFDPRFECGAGSLVVRCVTISTKTKVSEERFDLPAIIEYRTRGSKIASLRAFWEPRRAIAWHAGQGARGAMGLMRHGMRTTFGLGIGSAMGFGRALVPAVSRSSGREIAEGFARAMGSRAAWIDRMRGVRVSVSDRASEDAGATWDRHVASFGAARVEESIVAGEYVACLLTSGSRAAAIVARAERNTIAELSLVFSL